MAKTIVYNAIRNGYQVMIELPEDTRPRDAHGRFDRFASQSVKAALLPGTTLDRLVDPASLNGDSEDAILDRIEAERTYALAGIDALPKTEDLADYLDARRRVLATLPLHRVPAGVDLFSVLRARRRAM